MKNLQAMSVLAMGVVGWMGLSGELEARPPIKLFEASADEPGDQLMTISNASTRSGVEVDVPLAEDATRIEPTVHSTGSSMWIEAKVHGREVMFVVDTGATYTTLTPWFAKLIGVSPDKDAPTALFQTAGGRHSMPFGIMPSLEFGGVSHRHVTFAECAACGDEDSSTRKRPVVGLLGMNVLGRYTMNMDGKALTLFKGARHANRRADIAPWVTLDGFEAGDKRHDGGQSRWPVTVKIKNHSARDITRATLMVHCRAGLGQLQWEVEIEQMRSGEGTSATIIAQESPARCGEVDVDVVDATW